MNGIGICKRFKIGIATIHETRSKWLLRFDINDYQIFQLAAKEGKDGLTFLIHRKLWKEFRSGERFRIDL